MNDLFGLLAPELIVTGGAAAVLLLGVSAAEPARGYTRLVALFSVFLAFCVTWYDPVEKPVELAGMRFGPLSYYVRLIALSIGMLVLLVNWHLPAPQERGEHFAMILFSLTGIMLTSLADDLVLLFLAVELVSVPNYVLVSIGRSDIRAQEAGLKYFFLGALSAGLLVYGFSFLYGASGTTVLSRMSLAEEGGFVTVGLLLAFCGLAFKVAAVPFHTYAADVYQGAAAPVTGLLGFFPKVAGFVAFIKLLLLVQPPAQVLARGWDLPSPAFVFLWMAAAATMTVGNVLGLMQSNVKRMLAYSSIAHSGYMLVALLAGPVVSGGPLRDGLSAMLFYIVIYGVMNLGAFAVLALIQVRGAPAEELDDLAGLSRREPLAALALAVCVFSLMGMPPTAGFFGKVYVFSTALATDPSMGRGPAMVALAVVGLLNSAVAAGYYLRIVAACYLREPVAEPAARPRDHGVRLGLLGCCVAVLVLGVWPEGLLKMARMPFDDLTAPAGAVTRLEQNPPLILPAIPAVNGEPLVMTHPRPPGQGQLPQPRIVSPTLAPPSSAFLIESTGTKR
ncbi:MAG: NADH-quinone oxidoreductase subunit N [Phycisphaerae bacterium]|jgi:NADH-quinone oxidoreductase subunit N